MGLHSAGREKLADTPEDEGHAYGQIDNTAAGLKRSVRCGVEEGNICGGIAGDSVQNVRVIHRGEG